MDKKEENAELTAEEQTRLYASKYLVLRDRIMSNYEKGIHIYKKVRIITCIFFIIFTAFAVTVGSATGRPMTPLLIWIALLFLIVFLFVTADYICHITEKLLIPFLRDDSITEYPEYDITENDEINIEEQEDEQ